MGASPTALARCAETDAAILSAIIDAANKEQPCPSHKWLMDRFNVSSWGAVADSIKRLQRDGKIKIHNPTSTTRVVKIVSSGKSTADPSIQKPARISLKSKQSAYLLIEGVADALLDDVLKGGKNLVRYPIDRWQAEHDRAHRELSMGQS